MISFLGLKKITLGVGVFVTTMSALGFWMDRGISSNPYIDHGRRRIAREYAVLSFFLPLFPFFLASLPGIHASMMYDKIYYEERWEPGWQSNATKELNQEHKYNPGKGSTGNPQITYF